MKKIETTRQFDKDLKAIGLVPELIDVLHALVKDLPVPEKQVGWATLLPTRGKGCRKGAWRGGGFALLRAR